MVGETEAAVRSLEYPVLSPLPAIDGMEIEASAQLAPRGGEMERRLEEREKHFARELEAVRRESLEKGVAMARAEQAGWRQECALQLRSALEDFRARRDDYLAQVEREVVRLALAIAERILHREAQMDPLLLTGAVRVALGQLADSTEVRLRIPAEDKEMWAEMLRLMPALPLRPQVIADGEMHHGEAMLETGLGRLDLGVRAQIEEIERGFFDLLEVRRETGRADAPNGSGKQG